ncbi:MAG: hypothetical protein MZU91_00985 [Desulfosudis oleivorans]|nr:hypothetical protein [Desulfosudis oleivorans]
MVSPMTNSLNKSNLGGLIMSWDLVEMWHSMSIIPKAVVFTLVLMSVYCFATGIERLIVFQKAKKQSGIC